MRLGGVDGGSPAAVIIAVTGVAVAVMVMEFTLAVVVGFKEAIQDKLKGFDAEITVLPTIGMFESDAAYLDFSPQLDSVISSALPPYAEKRLSIRQPGMIKTDDNFQGVVYIGQSPDADLSFERENITVGEFPDFAQDSCENKIVISETLANSLGLNIGDRVYSTYIVRGNLKVRRHTIGALYQSNFGEYDNTAVYASLRGLQKIAGLDTTGANRIDIRGIATDDIPLVADDVEQSIINAAATGELDDYYPVDNILRSGAMYFNWLALLDTNVAVIFVLMLVVAGFTLVSSLFILILERLPMIGILRALGADKKLIRDIFIDMGMRLAFYGMVIGNVVALGLLYVQKATHFIKLDPAMYYLSSVPVDIRLVPMLAVNIGILLAIFLILLIPARVAASTDPSKTISQE